MKYAILTAAVAAFMSPAFAADQQHKSDETVDHFKNPITGTETTTKTKKVKDQNANSKAEYEIKDKTKVTKDGRVKHSREVEADSSSESH